MLHARYHELPLTTEENTIVVNFDVLTRMVSKNLDRVLLTNELVLQPFTHVEIQRLDGSLLCGQCDVTGVYIIRGNSIYMWSMCNLSYSLQILKDLRRRHPDMSALSAMFLHDVVRYRFDSEDYLKIVLTQVKTSERPARHLKDAKDTKIAFQELSWVDSILKSWAELLDVSCVSNDIISGQTEVDFEKWRWCFR